MPEHFKLMIPGATSSDGIVEVRAPYDGELIATIDSADAVSVETAMSTAYRLFTNRDAWLSPARRIAILEKLAAIMNSRIEQLAVEMAHEGGKPFMDSKVEAIRAVDSIKSCVEHLRTNGGEEIPMNLNASSTGKLAVTRREPRGVVVAVSAFNHPLNLIAHQVGPAIAVGCPVLVKPAGDTPISCLRFIQMAREAGLPDEWAQPIIVKDRNLATKMVTDRRTAFFSFIGSADVGWRLRSQLAPGTRCALEHGGVAPVIVAADADLDLAVPGLVKGGFYHAGQVCVSVQRIYAHESIAQKLGDRIAQAASKLKVGDPTHKDTEVGPIIRKAENDRVEQWVNEAIKAGTRVLTGGRRISDSCFECTVLYDPADSLKVTSHEVFGPVVCIYPYKRLDDAIARANSLPYAFQAAVYSKDIDTAMRCYSRLNASAVMVNEHTAFRVDWMPFAGLNESGYGIGGIPYTMHDMQVEKMLVLRSDELKMGN